MEKERTMQATTLRSQLAKLGGTLAVLLLLAALTSTVAAASAPPLGIPGPNGEVIGLDYLAARRAQAQAAFDPRSGRYNCFGIVCGAPRGTSAPSTTHSCAVLWGADVSQWPARCSFEFSGR
jgi:hypothetical protein